MLSPWLQPSAINSPLQAAAAIGFGGYDNSGSLDKRNNGDPMGTRNKINEYKTIAETLTNAFGNRSPYYIIGEIPEDNYVTRYSKYLGQFGGAVRAVTDLFTGKEQEGVIIDCLGDVSGNISIELTTNPILFKGSNIADGRLRKPNVVKAVVGVSNFNNDDIVDMAVDTLSALDPTGLLNPLINNGNTRAQTALYKLRWLQENGKPFKVYTPHGMYENMVITAIEPITNAGTMDMLFANVTFTEIIYAQPYFANPGDTAAVVVRETVVQTNKDGLLDWDKKSSTLSNIGKKIGSMF